MIVVDASVLVSALVPADVNHSTSRAWLGHQLNTGETLLAPIILLIEVGAAVARRANDAALGNAAVAHLERLPTLRLMPVSVRFVRQATRLVTELKLRAADSLYVALAAQTQSPLVSWDEEHHRRAGQRIEVRYP